MRCADCRQDDCEIDACKCYCHEQVDDPFDYGDEEEEIDDEDLLDEIERRS